MNSSDVARKLVYRIFGGVVDQKASILSPSIWALNSLQNIVLMPPKKNHVSSAPKPPKPPKVPEAWESYSQSF